MADYINGYGPPRFLIRESENGALLESIDLDKLIYPGMTESYEDEDIVHKTAKGVIHKITRYNRIRFTINYADYVKKDNSFKIQRVRAYERAGKAVFLVPNSDNLARFFQVVYSGDSFDLTLLMGGQNAPANKLPVLSWITKSLTVENWSDPDDIYTPMDDFVTLEA